MKRLRFIGIVLCALLLIGCAAEKTPLENTAATPEATAAMIEIAPTENTTVPEETVPPHKRVEPLPATLRADSLTDCMFPASFQAADVYLNDDGALVVHCIAYDYELFDLVDLSQLSPGDTIVIDANAVTVDTLERIAGGWVQINGGFEQGGYTLATQGDGVYFAVDADDMKHYRALGEATLRVAQEFTLLDDSDLEQPGKISYAGDFLMDMAASDRSFSPDDTTVTVEGGFITHITVAYVP